MTHIYVGNVTTIVSDNGLSPGRRQSIIWTNAGIFNCTLRVVYYGLWNMIRKITWLTCKCETIHCCHQHCLMYIINLSNIMLLAKSWCHNRHLLHFFYSLVFKVYMKSSLFLSRGIYKSIICSCLDHHSWRVLFSNVWSRQYALKVIYIFACDRTSKYCPGNKQL